MFAKASVSILLFTLLLQACSPAPIPPTNPEPTLTLSEESTAVPSVEPAVVSTATTQPTPEPTATVWPPAFVIWTLQDIRQLVDSFVVTINEKNTVNGELTELTHTIGFIKEPYSAYDHYQYTGGAERTYLVDGWTYELTGTGDWYISAGSNENIIAKADIPAAHTEKLTAAQFGGEEEYQGIPAYHFVLEPVQSSEGNTNYQLEGDLYLARDGNYVLYSHWKETSTQGDFTQVYEVTESVSSINQLTEIKLPADMEKMAEAIKVPAEIGLPLPGNSTVNRMTRYEHGIGVDLYYFTEPDISIDEFLDFYRNLPTTDGWQVSHVGHVSLHEADCEFSRECVMISKAGTQVILYYNEANIRAEFDWPHLYSPK